MAAPLRLHGRPAGPDRPRSLPIRADALLESATRATGLDDYGDPLVAEGVRVLCESAAREAHLHAMGRYHLRWLLARVLRTRLRLVDLRRRRQDLLRPTRPPLFVAGIPRSGTTALHRLLAAAEDARPLALYELIDPFPPAGPDRRYAETDRRLRGLLQVTPLSLDAQHFLRADLPDECGHLIQQSLRAMLFYQIPAHGYVEWLSAAEHETVYRDHAVLLALQEDPAKRLVLKDPYHFGHLGELFAAMPHAHVVQTHRDPVQAVPSLCQLLYTAHAAVASEVDPRRLADTYQRALDALLANNVAFRASGKGNVYDVDYRDFVRDPVGTVQRIHEHFGLGWSDATKARVQAEAAANPQYKHGRVQWSPDDFGLDGAALAKRYEAYRAAFIAERPAA